MDTAHPTLPAPPDWALWLSSIGKGAIFAALGAFALAMILGALGSRRDRFAGASSRLFQLGVVAIFTAFASLATLCITDQFGFKYVFDHSERQNGLAYKIASVWSAQEGSFLLWAVCAGLMGLAALRSIGIYRRWYVVGYSFILGSLAGILAFESPFNLIVLDGRAVLPPDGSGLVPALLNYWIVIHPPTIFLGFGSLTVLFAWAFSALAIKDWNGWVKPVRPWAIGSMTLLGVGLCMGGLWAYETLGWGGFWAWDPVENTSFVPWLIAVAFIHGIFVQLARSKWHFLNLMLGGLPMILFIYGTFLTRSGFLQDMSVHSFAEMNRTALWILVGTMGTAILGFVALWFARLIPAMKSKAELPPDDSKGPRLQRAYGWGIWLLSGMAVATGVGMSVPLIMALQNKAGKVVEEPVYHQFLVWFFIPIVLLMGLGPHLNWRGKSWNRILSALSGPLAFGLFVIGLVAWNHKLLPPELKPEANATAGFPLGIHVPVLPWVLFLLFLVAFAGAANFLRVLALWKSSKLSVGGLITHIGVLVTMFGLILSRGLERKEQIVLQQGRPVRAMGYVVSLDGYTKDYLTRDNRVRINLEQGKIKTVALPTLYYTERPEREPEPTARPYIRQGLTSDLYVALAPMVFEVGDPVTLQQGQKVQVEDTVVTYKGLRRKGEAGVAGTEFLAELSVDTPDGHFDAAPALKLGGESGLERIPVSVGEYMIFMTKMDAAEKSVVLEFHYRSPLFPVEIYYKPFTILVWIGPGLMGIGGLIAALYRARSVRSAPQAEAAV